MLSGMTGSISPLYEPAMLLRQAGVISVHDLTSEAASTKLSYSLALLLGTDDVTRKMSQPSRGELTERTQIAFEHPLGYLSSNITNLTVLGFAIALGNVDQVQELLKGPSEWMLSEGDYSGNTPSLWTKEAALILTAQLLKIYHNFPALRATKNVSTVNLFRPSFGAASSLRSCLQCSSSLNYGV